MPLSFAPFGPDDEPAVRGLVEHPSLAHEFDHLRGAGGVAREFTDPHLLHASCTLAALDGRAVGVSIEVADAHRFVRCRLAR